MLLHAIPGHPPPQDLLQEQTSKLVHAIPGQHPHGYPRLSFTCIAAGAASQVNVTSPRAGSGLWWLSGDWDTWDTGDHFWMGRQQHLISYSSCHSLHLVLQRRQQPLSRSPVSPPNLHYAKNLLTQDGKIKIKTRKKTQNPSCYLFIISFWAQISPWSCTFPRSTSTHGHAGWQPASEHRG